MTAFYNDTEAFAAEWTRRLIAAGLVAPGVVDERSIAAVVARELESYRQCHFFSGIGVWSYALRLAGWPDDGEVWTGSCPCQPFSIAGERGGFDDERHLWPTWFDLVRQRLPPIILGEQVASPDGLQWFDAVLADLEGAGYAVGAADLCAAGVGAPHIRQRLFFVAIRDGGRWRPPWLADWVAHADAAGWGFFREHEVPEDRDARSGDHADGRGADEQLAHATEHRRREECADAGGGGGGGGAPGLEQRSEHGGARGLGDACGAGLAGRQSQPGDDGEERETAQRTGGADCGVAHDPGTRRVARGRHGEAGGGGDPTRLEPGRLRDAGGAGDACWLGDARGDRDRQHAGELPGDEAQDGARGADPSVAASAVGSSGGLGNADGLGLGRGQGAAHGFEHHRQDAGRIQGVGGLVGADEDRRQGLADAGSGRLLRADGSETFARGNRTRQRLLERGGLEGRRRSFWSAADWIPCSDGKSRPVEPGTFPLAHGAPARVGRLRAYGNAINPWLAALFIRAVLEHMSRADGAPSRSIGLEQVGLFG